MDRRERYSDHEEALRAALDGHQAGLWTALPGQIVTFDPTKQTAQVQPTIQATVRKQDGTVQQVNLPVLPDVPVKFPGAGGYSLTFPVKPGDECLVVFSSRAIDAWWQSGGIQKPIEPRMHDLSDAIAILGPMSQPKKISGISTATTQLRNLDGSVHVDIDGTGQIVTVKAPTKIVLDTAEVHCTGKITTVGNVESEADVKAQTVSLHDHLHSGVSTGSANSGKPVP